MAPKMKQIQEKYKDDPTKLREEQSRLLAENSGAYAGMAMGCLPAMLQTPVWIGLSAMIYFNYDLRHSPAFFGVFQNMTGGSWSFLGDMSEPDHLIAFGRSFSVPLVGRFMGPIDGLNLLPLLLGVVFYLQQKYLQPPQATPMTPEQEQQAKIMRVMTVVLFPLMMYNAPAGLALYFATNSTLAILESK
jgi:YidC/Oxa1 family membrane protein insertase